MNSISLNNNFTSNYLKLLNHNRRNTLYQSSLTIFQGKCPVLFSDNQGTNFERRKRSDCSQDQYHMFSLLSFFLSSFTSILNIVNNANLNNNNNNNNNNDNNNNNNNLNVNMMKRKRKKRQGRG